MSKPVRYVPEDADRAYSRWLMRDCVECGDESTDPGCVCRWCPCCSRYWIAETREYGDENGRPHETCAECVEWEAAEAAKASRARETIEQHAARIIT